MTRVGQNPMKKLRSAYAPRPVTACTIVYIPALEGYWAESLDVLKLSISSALATAQVPLDFYVLDNGSCSEVRDFLMDLHNSGMIQVLLLSHENLGKIGAWNILFPACPGDYIAYFDSDVLFRPGWLENSLDVLTTFEDVGMVTAHPSRHPASISDSLLSATQRYADTASDVFVERGDLLPGGLLEEHLSSLGSDFGGSRDDFLHDDLRLTKDGVTAYAYSGHYQFVAPKDAVLQALPLDSAKALGGAERTFDQRLNALGKLRLSTAEPLVRHLGNRLEALGPEETSYLPTLGRSSQPPDYRRQGVGPKVGLLRILAGNRYGRAVLRRVYQRTFSALYETPSQAGSPTGGTR